MKIMFVSLGCDKNLVDTEMMLGMLSEKGYSFTDDENEADIAVVNTCCFIGDAKEESINQLLALGQKKTTGNLKGLIATGCLAQRYAKEIREDIPEVDVIVGTNAIDQIVLYYSQSTRKLQERSHGHVDRRGKGPGQTGN